eukprot:TRINITY_DN11866_c0_g1_i2.p1 TRINITY_DN11866_c0_g1~~TRINITY_DN11866_c0_g1_i2.p1  ORF type:complete len:484 (-),score=105.39 TRINITY_DN11866_c0_g1_i2:192-1643(-)
MAFSKTWPQRASFLLLFLSLAVHGLRLGDDDEKNNVVVIAQEGRSNSTDRAVTRRKQGLVPAMVVVGAQAIAALSSTVMTVKNMYTAVQTYKERKAVTKDMQEAFLQSRRALLEHAQKDPGKDNSTKAEMNSFDSLQALGNAAVVIGRIGEMCSTQLGRTSNSNSKYAALERAVRTIQEEARTVKEAHQAIYQSTCEGLLDGASEKLMDAMRSMALYRLSKTMGPVFAASFLLGDEADFVAKCMFQAETTALCTEDIPEALPEDETDSSLLDTDTNHPGVMGMLTNYPQIKQGLVGAVLWNPASGSYTSNFHRNAFQASAKSALLDLENMYELGCKQTVPSKCIREIIKCIPSMKDIAEKMKKAVTMKKQAEKAAKQKTAGQTTLDAVEKTGTVASLVVSAESLADWGSFYNTYKTQLWAFFQNTGVKGWMYNRVWKATTNKWKGQESMTDWAISGVVEWWQGKSVKELMMEEAMAGFKAQLN